MWTNLIAIWCSVASAEFVYFILLKVIQALRACLKTVCRAITTILPSGSPSASASSSTPLLTPSILQPPPTAFITTLNSTTSISEGLQQTIELGLLRRDARQALSTAYSNRSGLLAQLKQHWRDDKIRVVSMLLIALLLLAWYVAFNFGVAYTSRTAQGSLGISKDSKCDFYQVTGNSDPRTSGRNFELEAEERARLYGMDCYDKPDGADGCNLYANQYIKFEQARINCPFPADVCVGDEPSGIKFDTGFFSARQLGLNVASPHSLRRETVCAPVRTDNKYVRIHQRADGLRVAEYYYGNEGLEGDSWNGIGTIFTWNSTVMSTRDSPSYSVTTFRSASAGPSTFVLPEFRVQNHTITMIIIEQGQIFYSTERSDPIFPAHNQTREDAFGKRLWYNADYHGSVLMCADTWKICKKSSSNCWNRSDAPPPFKTPGDRVTDEDLSYALLWHGLLHSNTYHSLQQSQSYGLDAQRHINQLLVTGIADMQWLVESRLLFQSSLARLQQDIHDAERGIAMEEAGFARTIPAHYRGMCGIYKFRTVGYVNFDIYLTGLLFLVTTALWLSFHKFGGALGAEHAWRVLAYSLRLLGGQTRKAWIKVEGIYRIIVLICSK